ncbi:uncharacterized protein LOC129594689 [Paramacrobiotus metropolitanus]|uniref:uncharacterized protein LOC129594689 n=1 Tax=Paramacrobiotus metropolitanus TaxID=2943436 RepID=UPI0024456E53|nr:uncharacterized protein LOC129594689 [Paramacrobiotus metropolitanus]
MQNKSCSVYLLTVTIILVGCKSITAAPPGDGPSRDSRYIASDNNQYNYLGNSRTANFSVDTFQSPTGLGLDAHIPPLPNDVMQETGKTIAEGMDVFQDALTKFLGTLFGTVKALSKNPQKSINVINSVIGAVNAASDDYLTAGTSIVNGFDQAVIKNRNISNLFDPARP